MQEKTFLMIPGPTPVPQSVLHAIAKHPIGHRSPEFSSIMQEVFSSLQDVFQTKHHVFVYTSSGTGAMCGALENLLNPKDRVLCLVIGNFGERWAKIAQSRGAEVEILRCPLGETISPETLKEYLHNHPPFKIITLTHSETSTGAANDLKALCPIIKQSQALCVVDGITSVGAMDCNMDALGIDVLVSGSQKGLMLPPGLAFLAVSPKAMQMHQECLYPSFYFNWNAYEKSLEKNTTPFTPAVNLIVGLHQALKILQQQGIQASIARHQKHALALRDAIRALKLELLVKDDAKASYAITAILPPQGIEVPQIRKILKEDFDILVANGQNTLENKIFRIGTLGFVCHRDLLSVVSALEGTLLKLGYTFDVGIATKTLLEKLI